MRNSGVLFRRIFQLRITLPALLIAATAVAYYPVANFEFTYWDDDQYITDNPHVLAGLSWEGARWAFTTGHMSNWHPLTWLSHMLDCELFGRAAGPPHIENVLFHVANSWLLFHLLVRMTGAVGRSACVAFLFALHPLHVESVAWVAERKDVLSTFFWFLGLLAYLRYVERPGWFRYSLVMLALALGLLAKPMLVTFPCVLLLLDFWPLGRFATSAEHGTAQKPWVRLMIEKLPMFALVIASSVVTFLVQQADDAVASLQDIPFIYRLANVAWSYIIYIRQAFWPTRLACFYPYPVAVDSPREALQFFLAAGAGWGVLLITLTVIGVRLRRRYPYLIVGWLWYLGTLVTVIGLVQVGSQARADRYMYVPLVGLLIGLVWWLDEALKNYQWSKLFLRVDAVLVILACLTLTARQVPSWRNTRTLFEHALTVTENNYVAYLNLGNVLLLRGNIDGAIAYYKMALAIYPRHSLAWNNLGTAYFQQGQFELAIKACLEAIRIDSNFANAHKNLGHALLKLSRHDEALVAYRQALELNPTDTELRAIVRLLPAESLLAPRERKEINKNETK